MLKPQLFVMAAFISLGLAGCKEDLQDPRTSPPLVKTMTMPKAELSTQAYTGVVVARIESNLGFRVPGKVLERLVDTGQTITKGQALMRIDSNDLNLNIKAKDELVKAVKARAIEVYADEMRTRELLKSEAVSQKSYEQAKAAADSVRAELSAAEAEAEIARNEGNYSLLVADADGTIVDTYAEPGQVVAAGQAVIKLAHKGQREASVSLPETIRPTINSSAETSLYGSPHRGTAHLRQLSGAADAQTRTFEARYVLDTDAAQAPLGATVTVYLRNSENTPYVEVPIGAVTDKGNGPGVWVVSSAPYTVSFRPVEIVSITQETAIIKTTLTEQDRIIALGAQLLHEGMPVQLESSQVSQ